jgi:elongation factor P
MISVTDLKAGTIFEKEGQIYEVLSYEHIKMGRGSATIKIKIRNVRTGSTTEKSFISGARVNDVQITKKELQFLYKDSDSCYFMDPLSFEQTKIPIKLIPKHQYLREGAAYSVNFLENEPLSVNFSPKMEFIVIETGPSIKGNSATNIFKEAVLENNIKTKVPLFIKVGDKIRIDTRTNTYTEKVA